MNLLFDLDGTLAEPWAAFSQSLDYAFRELGLEPLARERVRGLIGPPLHLQLPEILGAGRAHLAPEVMRLYREHHGREGIYAYAFYPGMAETLRALAGSHRLFVATSKPWVYAREIFRHLRATDLFEEIYGSELSGERAKKGELISYILSERRLAAGETVMIGDRRHDLIGARENGMRAIGVLWGYGSEAELRGAQADWVCASWDELRDVLTAS